MKRTLKKKKTHFSRRPAFRHPVQLLAIVAPVSQVTHKWRVKTVKEATPCPWWGHETQCQTDDHLLHFMWFKVDVKILQFTVSRGLVKHWRHWRLQEWPNLLRSTSSEDDDPASHKQDFVWGLLCHEEWGPCFLMAVNKSLRYAESKGLEQGVHIHEIHHYELLCCCWLF